MWPNIASYLDEPRRILRSGELVLGMQIGIWRDIDLIPYDHYRAIEMLI